ncbi:cyclase family protein [Ilyobacter polytropus]|uniref:Cyclase family protein n=1 Tax=Ilyobacter polytropus (strain ATCC 51220 / DSM 2926 / LMG 16218 / CuHBu1) TaxID=572544 RepID=E3HDQ0_ILYPC|nr:cyclase family protein [Ilyobacter polytropus]ADO84236.1 cyclase family protein [Ilyobacter polytropus DSM 2926]
MKIVDLTHEIRENMPVFPGSECPKFESIGILEKDGFEEKKITIYSHTGTHMDAPKHIIPYGKGLDEFSADKFLGKGVVVDARGESSISLDLLIEYEEKIEKSDFILINTGWDRNWGKENYYNGFPCMTKKAAQWLSSKKIKGLGIDAISVDPVNSYELVNHNIFLKKEIVIIENLKIPEKLHGKKFLFSALPLKTENSDGSPIRAVAILDI